MTSPASSEGLGFSWSVELFSLPCLYWWPHAQLLPAWDVNSHLNTVLISYRTQAKALTVTPALSQPHICTVPPWTFPGTQSLRDHLIQSHTPLPWDPLLDLQGGLVPGC